MDAYLAAFGSQAPEAGSKPRMIERDLPAPWSREVRLRVAACGVCHSDSVTVPRRCGRIGAAVVHRRHYLQRAGENEFTFDLYLPTGNRRWADGPVAIVGHGATSHKHNVTPVSDVAVFGIPDPEFGKSLAAHGELVPGADITVEGIRAHAAAHMAKYKDQY